MSTPEGRQTRHELAPFFGNDGRADLFIKLFLPNFNESINEREPTSLSTDHTMAYDIMRAQNYDASSKPAGMDDNDLHYDFTDFIIQTALFHRLIDTPTGAGNAKTTLNTAGVADASRILWNDIYMKWDQLTPASKQFYNMYMNFQQLDVGTGTWQTISDNQMGQEIDPNNYAQYRVNLKKVSAGGAGLKACPRFFNLVPKVSPKIFNNIWFSNSTGNKIKVTGWQNVQGVNVLKKLYCGIVLGVTNADGTQGFTSLPTAWQGASAANNIFVLDVDRLIRRRLFRLQQLMKSPEAATPQGPFISLADKNIWKRDASGRLYTDSPNGPVYYGEDDDATKNMLTANFKCYSTLTNGTPDECKKYMYQCLLNADLNDIDGCIEFWKKNDFYTDARNEISQMHPLVAIRTLQKFGFRDREEYDPVCRSRVLKIESKDHWVANYLSTKFAGKVDPTTNTPVEQIITQNEKLLDYLQLLVEYVNANPAILNGDKFVGKTLEATGTAQQSDLAKRLGIRMRVDPKGPMSGLYDFNMLRSRLNAGINSRRQGTMGFGMGGPVYSSPFASQEVRVAMPYQLSVGNGPQDYSSTIPFQLGGHMPIDTYLKRRDSGVITGPAALYAIIKGTLEDLRSKGKEIDPKDLVEINKKVDTLQTLENELIKTEVYLEEYRKIVDLFRNYRQETIDFAAIQNLVDKQTSLVDRQGTEECSLVNILGALQEILNDQVNKQTDSGYKQINL
jgi:hypothetical protein